MQYPTPPPKNMINFIENIIWYIKHKFKILWLIIKYRSFFKCPICDGEGGKVDYWGEWAECCCDYYWDELYDEGLYWFCGKLPLLQYIIAKDTESAHMVGIDFKYYLACKLGIHDINYDEKRYGKNNGVCKCCYEFFKDGKKVNLDD